MTFAVSSEYPKKTIDHYIEEKNAIISRLINHEIDLHMRSVNMKFHENMSAIDELIYLNKYKRTSGSIHSPLFYADLEKYHAEVYNNWIGYKRKRMYEMLSRNLQKCITEGLFRKEMNVHAISRLYMARIKMLHSSELIEEEEISNTELMDELFINQIHAICISRGLEYFKSIKL